MNQFSSFGRPLPPRVKVQFEPCWHHPFSPLCEETGHHRPAVQPDSTGQPEHQATGFTALTGKCDPDTEQGGLEATQRRVRLPSPTSPPSHLQPKSPRGLNPPPAAPHLALCLLSTQRHSSIHDETPPLPAALCRPPPPPPSYSPSASPAPPPGSPRAQRHFGPQAPPRQGKDFGKPS